MDLRLAFALSCALASTAVAQSPNVQGPVTVAPASDPAFHYDGYWQWPVNSHYATWRAVHARPVRTNGTCTVPTHCSTTTRLTVGIVQFGSGPAQSFPSYGQAAACTGGTALVLSGGFVSWIGGFGWHWCNPYYGAVCYGIQLRATAAAQSSLIGMEFKTQTVGFHVAGSPGNPLSVPYCVDTSNIQWWRW